VTVQGGIRRHPHRGRSGAPSPITGSLEDVRNGSSAQRRRPMGGLDGAHQSYTIAANDQIST
jgi:hypothetical protein